MFKTKKKILCSIIALIIAVTVSIPLIANALNIYNDPNGDGDILLNDSVLITQYLGGVVSVNNLEKLDFDNDDIISMADAYEIQLYNLGLLNPGTIYSPSASTYNGLSSETYHVFDASTGDYLPYNSYSLFDFNPIPNNTNEPDAPDAVIGNDGRIPSWDKSGIVKIISTDGVYNYYGTGFVIAPHIIATAAHCVFDYDAIIPDNLSSQKGYVISNIRLFNNNGVNTLNATPVECHVPWSYISSAFDRLKVNAYDYALISVEEDLSDYMCFNLGVALDSAVTNETDITISGFPGTVNGNTVNNSYLDQMYLGTGSLVEWSDYISAYYYNLFQYNDDRMFFYDVDTSGGNSGGPIYVTKHVYDKNGNNHQVYYDVIGICTAEFTEYGIGVVNMGMRMNGELLRFYLDNNNINW
ncbi:serine protease [Ruminococcus sp.]|uniref:trypsin-like serine peptidase n=1 Tax=Ruminococcus sp. TaxID=41978 RepID=UPI001B5AD17C|nr:serine protease [Ruminococcus sp.]MBP5431935.1 trypsin-like peptidase domain-containing protein [Ruminococcus sp.]